MFWQFKNDLSGSVVKAATNGLIAKMQADGLYDG